jgi:hypothetical protein
MERVLSGAGRKHTIFFFNFDGSIIQLQRPEGQKRSVKEIFLDRKNQRKNIFRDRIRPNFNKGLDTIDKYYDSQKDFKLQNQTLVLS